MKSEFTFIDLFAGIGGFHHALKQLGGRCVLACEFDEEARRVYSHSFPESGDEQYKFPENIRTLTRNEIDDPDSLKDISEIDSLVPDHDVICGGFPCQPFSKSGGQKGVRDTTRGTLFFDIVQIVEAKRPKYIFLENVRNITGPRHANTWATVISSIRELGYHISSAPMIFSPHFLPRELGGAPQVRERVFILGVRNDLTDEPLQKIAEFNSNLRAAKYWNPHKWNIADFLDADSSISGVKKYHISENEATYVEAWNYFVRQIPCDKLPGFPIWAFSFSEEPCITPTMPKWERDFRIKNSAFYVQNREFIDSWMSMRWGKSRDAVADFPFSRQKFEWQAGKYHAKREGRSLDDLVLQFRPSGIRVKPPTYLPALVAISQTSVMGPRLRGASSAGYRKLTPKEASRLQSIPERVYSESVVSDQAAYKQLGNAVNVGMVREVARLLLGLEGISGRNSQGALPFIGETAG